MALQNRTQFVAILCACAFVLGCTKKWDEHNSVTDPLVAGNLYQNISKTSGLAKFSDYLVKTGYDKILASSKTFTVWVPTDAALASLDPTIVSDTAKLRLFVTNHISYQSYLVSASEQRIAMLNGKYMTVAGTKFDSATITIANQYAANGVFHVIDKFIPRYNSCWEFMLSGTASPLMKTYLVSQNYNFFDPSVAKQTGVNSQGLPVYDTATGLSQKNHFLEDALDVSDEKELYTMILLNDAAFTTEYNKITPWFKTGSTDSTNKLSSFWLTKDLVFKGSYNASQLPDTLLSVSGVKVPVNKPSIIASYKTSNGWVHVMSKVDFTKEYKFPPLIIQGENPTFFAADRTANTFYRIRNNPVTGLNFSDILMQNYNYANYYINYLVKNVNSMRYNVSWVAVNDVQTTPLWQQRLAIDSTNGSATNLAFVTVAYKNYSEVSLGQITITNFRNLNLFVMGPTTASTSGGVNSISLDYIKLVPAF
ncbi:MAG: fasciclin domain-containing protein [Bacteroidota bacterium]